MRILIDLQGCQTGSAHRGIGRYSLALAQAMARNAGEHEITLALNGHFPEAVLELRRAFDGLIPLRRISVFDTPASVGELGPANAWRVRAAELLRENFLADLHPDIVHVSSLFEGQADNAVSSVGLLHDGGRTAVTLYDLIPLMNSDRFLSHDPVRRWYYRKLQSLKNCGVALAISEASRREAIEALDLPPERVVNISSAAAAQFRPISVSAEALRGRLGFSRPIVMCVTTGEYHKNLTRMLESFALIEASIRTSYQLLVICVHEERFAEYRALCDRLGLDRDEVIFVRRVSDEDLVGLYNIATLFVLPSLHEGFGLPALEAMSCGAPTIGSNLTSIPEVIGRGDALFDPLSTASITGKMVEALTDEGFRRSLSEHGLRRAESFSWDMTAKRAFEALEMLHAQRESAPTPRRAVARVRPRLAYVASLCPQDVADFHAAILPALAHFYDVDVIAEPATFDPGLTANFELRSPASFEADADQYDRVIYYVSSGDAHGLVLSLLGRRPGTVILREFFLGRLLSQAETSGQLPTGALAAALFRSHGYPALLKLARDGRDACIDSYPANLEAVDMAAGVIVHAASLMGLAEEWFGREAIQHWVHLPMPGGDAVEVAQLYQQAIERFSREHPLSRRESLLDELAQLDAGAEPGDADVADVAACLARNRPSLRKTLYLDISYLARTDHGSGIHRVVRSLVRELTSNPPAGVRVEPIRHISGSFRSAHAKTCELLGIAPALVDEVVEFKAGDIFLGLDLTADSLPPLKGVLTAMRARGVEMRFVVYDLLPALHPEWFPDAINSWFLPWLSTITECADGLTCISRSVACEVCDWLVRHPTENGNCPEIGFFHLGADLASSVPSVGMPADAPTVLEAIAARPSFLMVGTVEPRKGCATALAAFDQLWNEGADVNLVIVGPQGWNVEALVERLSAHPERARRLFWLGRITDEYLDRVYAAVAGFIAASEGEGFGLPLVEAARHGRPVIASDIPVFREVAASSRSVLFFDPGSADALTATIRRFLREQDELQMQANAGKTWITWVESAAQLCRAIFGPADA